MPDYSYETMMSHQKVMGLDEVGYGAWAGPVVVAAVYLDVSVLNSNDLMSIDDSKKLSLKKRQEVASRLHFLEGTSVFSSIAMISSDKIDQLGIKKATHVAMHTAVQGLMERYSDFSWGGVLIDGVSAPQFGLPAQCIVRGDGKSLSIAAASILAKVARDQYMKDLSHQYPMYRWDTNVGYGTQEHQRAIQEHGCCPCHRFSYKPLQGYRDESLTQFA